MTRKFDYIIAGAGAAGLSLLMHMIKSGAFSEKNILLVDRSSKNINDRTWCFWESTPGIFEEIVYHSWNKMWFHSDEHSTLHDISPLRYKLIRGIEFYNYCFDLISRQQNITVLNGTISSLFSDNDSAGIVLDGEKVFAEYVFNSILPQKINEVSRRHYLLQHFKGWYIRSEQPAFDAHAATLMDFRVKQQSGATFVYVMPFSQNTALVEYTVFSKQLLADEQYDQELASYCREQLDLSNYTITEEEYGVIPMTDHPFERSVNNIINIGTAGGYTKPSSGYTFQFIQENSRDIVKRLANRAKPFKTKSLSEKRFSWYDSLFLEVLSRRNSRGNKIFENLFEKNKMHDVMKFLDNNTSVVEDIRLIKSLPAQPFIRAALRSVFL